MVVQHNLTAINANRYYGMNNNKLAKSLEKLSSGYAINRAGDNAAGLAVSEKMRAQISGLTQAAKNAQDGISMVQTYEGALTETDSILQRMRSLAVQSANGSYDDEIDRNAIEQEFKQLNNELDQIADTDFNGVVVLNGGKMADGLEAVDGKFDYANKEAQLIANAKGIFAQEKAEIVAAYNDALSAFNKENYDLSDNGNAPEWNTLDSNLYGTTQADALWKQLGITSDGTDTGDVKTDVINEVSITFKKQADGSWAADSAEANSGKTWKAADLTTITATAAADGAAGATGLGGFSVRADGTALNVDAIFDATQAKAGDTVTITFTNGKTTQYAPTNIGYDEKSIAVTGNVAKNAVTVDIANTLEDDTITDDVKAALDALEGIKIDAKYDATANFAAGDLNITDASGAKIDISQITNAGANVTINGVSFTITGNNANAGESTVFTVASAGGQNLMTITATVDDADGTDGTFEGNVSISTANYSPNSSIYATVGKNTDLGTSAANKKTLEEAKAALDEINSVIITDYDEAKEYVNKNGVSVSDAFDKSAAVLTYSDNVTLQVGARTKDAVNFTFEYQSTAMGDLESDLNCTAEGLGTDKLTLATQEEANAAIDKIDNAINKVSMVRASFGAIQNRLEHKIDNLNTTNENLTAAESRIRDTNMAEEMMNFTKNQILSQASQSMLAQANTLPQGVLALLQ